MRQPTKADAKHLKSLYEAILSLESVDECRRFFADLCTPAELTALSDRWRVAKLLQRDVPYRKIYERTGVSTATVTRVARALTLGSGGYALALDRMDPKGDPKGDAEGDGDETL